jgi:hypothetical protein
LLIVLKRLTHYVLLMKRKNSERNRVVTVWKAFLTDMPVRLPRFPFA